MCCTRNTCRKANGTVLFKLFRCGLAVLLCQMQLNLVQAQLVTEANQAVKTVQSSIRNKALSPIKNIQSIFKQSFKPGLSWNALQVQDRFMYSRNLISTDLFSTVGFFQQQLELTASVSIAGIPLRGTITHRQASPSLLDPLPKTTYQFSFDASAYQQQWSKALASVGPEVVSSFKSELDDLQKTVVDRVTTSYKEQATDQMHQVMDSISGNLNPLELEGKSYKDLAMQFFGEDLEKKYETYKAKYESLQSMDWVKEKKDSALASLDSSMKQYQRKLDYVKKIEKTIQQAKQSGLLKLMKEYKEKGAAEYRDMLKDPMKLGQQLARKFNIPVPPKWLSMLSGFKLGGQSVPFAEKANVPMLSNGISFELEKGDRYMAFSTGKILPVSNLVQLANQPMNMDSATKSFFWSVEYRKGKLELPHKGIRLTSISGDNTNGFQTNSASLTKKTRLLVNLYMREHLVADNWISVELSKSFVVKEQLLAESSNSQYNIKQRNNDFFNADNLMIGVKTEGKIEHLGLTHQAFFNKRLGAYSNLIDYNIGGTGFETGAQLKFKPKGKPFAGSLKANWKKLTVPGNGAAAWQNLDVRVSGSYKIKKGKQVQVSAFMHDGYKSYLFANEPVVTRLQSSGATIDFNLSNKRVLGLYGTTYLCLGLQKDVFPETGTLSSGDNRTNSLNVIINQSLLYGEQVIQANLIYNRVFNNLDAFLFNTRLDLDGGMTFKLGKQIQAGASLVYGYMKHAYQNIGIKANCSGKIWKGLSWEMTMDLRRNITLENPLFRQFVNMNGGVRYQINK